MKKSVIVLMVIILSVFTTSLQAQNFSLGVKCGLNIPRLTAGKSDNPINKDYESRFGPTFGVYGECHYSDFISFYLGMEYSSQGGQKDKYQAFYPTGDLIPVAQSLGVSYLYADFMSVARLNYMLVPVLAKFNWSHFTSLPVKIYTSVGPFFGLLLNAKQVTSGSGIIYADENRTIQITPQPVSFDNTQDIKDELYKFNCGFYGIVGVGYDLSPKSSVFIEGGGNYGFTPLQKEDGNGRNYAGAGSVTLGFALNL